MIFMVAIQNIYKGWEVFKLRDIDIIDFTDFCFNGRYISDLGGMVGSNSGGSLTFSILPSREYITDRPFYYDGEIVFATKLNPRVWEVPVFFEDLSNINIRQIAAWLITDEDAPFYFKGDTARINCRLDSDAFYLDTYSGIEGLTSLKFIAHDPHYYDINSTQETLSVASVAEQPVFINTGNTLTPCKVKIRGNGTIRISVIAENEYNSLCIIDNVVDGVIVDSERMTCTSLTGEDMYGSFSGIFPMIPSGKYRLTAEGAITTEITYYGKHMW